MTPQRLELRRASKTFGATKVLSDAHLGVAPGAIHALVGQNGSGKSTLIKILTGYHAPDRGMELALDGKPLALPVQWRDARSAGLAVVHQDMGLLNDLSVSENIGIGGFVHSRVTGKINWKRQAEVARRILDRLAIDVDPTAVVGTLPSAHRASVAIARALRDTVPGEGVLILDEATRSLPRSERSVLHGLLRRIADSGTAIIMVSHSLEEVLEVADEVTVLRDGAVVAAGLATAGLSASELAKHMLGKTVDAVSRTTPSSVGPRAAATRVDGLQLPGHRPLDFEVGAGEVVGITGLPGSGFEQIPYVLGGGLRAAGTLTTPLGTADLARTTVEAQIKMGVALVPERRIDEGLAVELSVRDNLSLPNVRRRGKPWFVARDWQDSLAKSSITDFGIKARSGLDLVRELSGGNQQKVLLAKWLSVQPRLLVLHEPTQAVDVGARADLLRAVDAIACDGTSVLLVSTEPADLVEICDRVLVIHPGTSPVEVITDNPEHVLNAVYSAAEAPGAMHA